MTQKLFSAVAAIALSTTFLNAYDADLAQKMDQFYKNMTFQPLSKSNLVIEPEAFVEEVKNDPSIVIIDIRTPEEQSFIKTGYGHTLEIPLDRLFDTKNLDRIPTDKRLVIVCHSGTRAIPAALNLKMLGFKDVQVLKEGIVGLARISSPKTCIMK
jgi:rhodanese-related sulfurtransferase